MTLSRPNSSNSLPLDFPVWSTCFQITVPHTTASQNLLLDLGKSSYFRHARSFRRDAQNGDGQRRRSGPRRSDAQSEHDWSVQWGMTAPHFPFAFFFFWPEKILSARLEARVLLPSFPIITASLRFMKSNGYNFSKDPGFDSSLSLAIFTACCCCCCC